jgi:lipoprotein-anchoring transpeptidase ErfK/SrfK
MTVDVKKHKLTVVRDGRQVRSFDVSTGKPGWETRNGIKVIMDKERNKVWTNEAIDAKEDYRFKSRYAMRITNSGEFVHDAPWNTGNIGEANTSHGCVGLLPKSMDWLWKNTILGDPVVVTGSPKPFDDLQNRIADWNVPWSKWMGGNTDQHL